MSKRSNNAVVEGLSNLTVAQLKGYIEQSGYVVPMRANKLTLVDIAEQIMTPARRTRTIAAESTSTTTTKKAPAKSAAKKSPAKRASKSAAKSAPAAKSAAKKAPSKRASKSAAKSVAHPNRFITAEHEATGFVCVGCGVLRSVKAFPPAIRSNDPSVRKTECRKCRTERIAAAKNES